MKEQMTNALNWCKSQEVAACITGSSLLDYFEGQDIDMFAYTIPAFNELLFAMKHDPMFIIADPKEEWKLKKWTSCNDYKFELSYNMISIKFKYNTCVDINLIYKKKAANVFDVLSSFDMDIICKGYDLKSKRILDLTSGNDKIADWNRWNPQFREINAWSLNRLLRQFQRVIKYHKRGYNTDLVCSKYRDIMLDMTKYVDIWKTDKTIEKVKKVKSNSKILINILEKWLETHDLNKEELLLLDKTIKEL